MVDSDNSIDNRSIDRLRLTLRPFYGFDRLPPRGTIATSYLYLFVNNAALSLGIAKSFR